MKKLFSLVAAALLGLSASATLNGDGYYRVKNYGTGRYIYVTDNKGKVDYTASSVELGAIKLFSGFDRASSDPATILYITKVQPDNSSSYEYDITGQGTGIHAILETYVKLRYMSNHDTYLAYGSYSGFVKYLGDAQTNLSLEEGKLVDSGSGDYREWYILPVGSSDDDFFGIKSQVSVNGNHYAAMFTEFPYTIGQGMKAYCITKVDSEYGVAVYQEITSGAIAPATPVIIKCTSTNPVDNKVTIGTQASAPSVNLLKGVYFCNESYTHKNVVPYDANTMRVLGVGSEGKLAYITATYTNIPANLSYLPVPAGTPAECKLMTQSEYEAYVESMRPVEAQSVTLSASQLTLEVGQTAILSATVMPENTTDKTVTWTSSNPAAATVDANGKVTAVFTGEAVITATCGNVSAQCTVTVKPIAATSISLNVSNLDLFIGGQATLTATVLPDNAADKTVTWSSSASWIATVDGNGTVTAVAVGQAVITAHCGDLSATCTVNVSPVLPTGISLNYTSLSLEQGTTATLVATVTPENATDKTVTWTSSNRYVVSVDSDGLITALLPGSANITASCGGFSASCNVIVSSSSGVESVVTDDKPADVYNTQGVLVRRAATTLKGLAPGVYIVGGEKVIVK